MSWGIRCTFNPIQSHAQAVKAWKKAVIFPRDREGPRGLVDRRKKHLTIERTAAEDIVLRLYDHPTVTWHKDNSITICAYSTKSTGAFANHCTPVGMYVSATGTFRVTVDSRTYKVTGQITFRQHGNTWKADKITPWSVPVVNRERAKQALDETGYNEFRLWFKTYVQMAPKPDGRGGWIDNANIVTMLRDRRSWRDLVTTRFPNTWGFPDRALHEIRQAIYHECGCFDRKSVPFLG